MRVVRSSNIEAHETHSVSMCIRVGVAGKAWKGRWSLPALGFRVRRHLKRLLLLEDR